MQIAIGLLALIMIAAVPIPGAAQDLTSTAVAPLETECAEYFSCLHYGMLTEEQARSARGHPQFVEPQTAAIRNIVILPNVKDQTSRVAASSRP